MTSTITIAYDTNTIPSGEFIPFLGILRGKMVSPLFFNYICLNK